MSEAAPPITFVLGPSRSGTSVVTRTLNLLGLHLAPMEDLYRAADNPDGHWESQSLIDMNDQLLTLAGASWGTPPSETAMAEAFRSPRAARLARPFAARFQELHPVAPALCKDPRLSFTFPFWSGALATRVICVIPRRNPTEIVQSLNRDGVPKAHSIALWERYLLAALRSSEGSPLVVADYDGLVTNTEPTVRLIWESLRSLGLRLEEARIDEATAAVRATRRRHTTDGLDADFSGAHAELWRQFCDVPAVQTSANALGMAESPWTTELIGALHRETAASAQLSRGFARRALRRLRPRTTNGAYPSG